MISSSIIKEVAQHFHPLGALIFKTTQRGDFLTNPQSKNTNLREPQHTPVSHTPGIPNPPNFSKTSFQLIKSLFEGLGYLEDHPT